MLIYVCAGEYEIEGDITQEGNLTHASFKLALEVGETIRRKYGKVSCFITSPYLQARETADALKQACRKKKEHPKITVDTDLSKWIKPSMEGRLELTKRTLSYDPPLYETKKQFIHRVEGSYRKSKNRLSRDDRLIVYVTHPDYLSIITNKPKCDISLKNFIVLELECDSSSSSSSSDDDDCKKKCCRKKKCKCQEIISPCPPGVQCPPPCPPPFPPRPCPPSYYSLQFPIPCLTPCPPCPPPCPPPCTFAENACPDSPFIKKTLGRTCGYCYQVVCVCNQ